MNKSTFLNGYKPNYDTLLRAADDKNLALMECTDSRTGELVPVVCAVYMEGEAYNFVPLARMLDGNPYEYLNPPKGAKE